MCGSRPPGNGEMYKARIEPCRPVFGIVIGLIGVAFGLMMFMRCRRPRTP